MFEVIRIIDGHICGSGCALSDEYQSTGHTYLIYGTTKSLLLWYNDVCGSDIYQCHTRTSGIKVQWLGFVHFYFPVVHFDINLKGIII